MSRRRIVMISSTARDLPKHREQVRLACERAGFEPREMMEHLTALNRGAVEASLRMVEEADLYLGVIAYRYGTAPKGYDLSITEMEFNRAIELGKPWLVLKDHPVLMEDMETDHDDTWQGGNPLHATPLVSDLGLDAGSRRVLFPKCSSAAARQLNGHDGTLVPSRNIRGC